MNRGGIARHFATGISAIVLASALVLASGIGLSTAPIASATTIEAHSYYENKQVAGGTQIENHGSYFEVWNNGLVDNFPSSLVDSYANTENFERVAYSVHEPAKAGRSFSPSVRNTFSWRPTDTIQKKGPLENYVENQGENIRIESYPTYVEVLRDENFANDNYQYVIENIPDDWIVSENSTFVEFEPPGKPVWVWDMNVIQENVLGRFKKSGPASVYKVQFTVKPNDVTRAVEGAYENLDASIFNSDYYYKRREADLTDISALENELEEIPVHASVGSFENAVTRPITPPTGGGRNWIDLGGSNKITLTINLNKQNPGYALASGRLGSHSLSWTASSSTDWWSNSSPSENDVRTTIDNTGNLVLSGENAALWMPLDNFPSGFGSTDNTVYDLTSLNNNGTAYDNGDNLNIVFGKRDNALEFDGVDDYVNFGDTDFASSSGKATVTAWVNLDAIGVGIEQSIVTRGYDGTYIPFELEERGGSWSVGTYDGEWYRATAPATAKVWTFLAGVFKNGTWYLYVNGTQENSVAYNGTLPDVSGIRATVGGRDQNGTLQKWTYGKIDEPRIYDRALSENEIKRIYNRTKPTSFDPPENSIKVGTWTSQVWNSGDTCIVENIEYSALIDTNENVWWNIEATDTNENTGWFQDEDNLIAQSELPNNIKGENFQLEIKLETDNSTSSPNVQDYTLNVDPAPTVRSVSVDNTLIDRDIDYSGSGADDNCTITATIRDNDGLPNLYKGDNAPQFSIRDNSGGEVAHRPVAWENLVGYWDFQDNSSLDVWDKSAENNAGTMYNMTVDNYVSGKRGRALEFDGVDDYVDAVDDPMDLSAPCTLAAWVWIDSGHPSGTEFDPFGKYDGDGYIFRDSGADRGLQFYFAGNAHESKVHDRVIEGWEYWAVTWDGSDIKYYTDGELFDTVSTTDSITSSAVTLKLMQRGDDAFYAMGKIDDVRIYDRALTENEIKEIYRSGLRYHEVDENTVEISTTYNPADSLADSRLGGFDARVDVVDNAGASDNLENADLFTVDDRTVENIAFENNYEHVLKVTADSARMVGSASVTSATLTDNNLGDYDMGSDLAVSYETTQDGKVTVKATDDNIDGISSSKPYTFPNFRPSVDSVSVDENLIDRDVDSPGFGSVDNATITYTVSDPDNRTNDLDSGASALLSVRDNCDENQIADDEIISSRIAVDENAVKVSKTYDPSDSLPDENLGFFDTKLDLTDHYGMENVSGFIELGHKLFAVDDRKTTINYSPEQMLYSGDKVTIGGKVSGFYEAVSLDNVVLKDSVDGTFRPGILDNDSWEVTYSVSQGRHEVTVGVLDKGSRLDGSKTLRFDVESGKSQPSFNPTKQNLNIDLKVGLYQGREPTKGGRIEFQPSSKFNPGDRVTVVAYLTANGVEISHADITGSWNGNSFPLGDKKANRFVGTFTIPKDTKPGSYLVSVDASARGLQSTASKTITVQRAKKGINLVRLAKDYWFIIVIAIILLLIALE